MEYLQHVDDVLVRQTCSNFPGHDVFISHIATLLTTCPPAFIYIHDPHTVHGTAQVLRSVLSTLSAFDPSEFTQYRDAPRVTFAQLDAISCFVPRLFYDSALNQLAKWNPTWIDGCENWTNGSSMRFNDSFDGFIHGIQALEEQLREPGVRMVLLVDHAERMKDALHDLVVPLTRLAELSRVDVTTIFLSEVVWEEIKPAKGAAVDPYRMSVSAPGKETAILKMLSNFSAAASVSSEEANPYHPSLSSLYEFFITTLYDTCALFTKDPDELAYIAAARWPGFVQPVLDAYSTKRAEDPDTELDTTGFESRVRLMTHFKSTFVAALEELLPRLTNASAWAEAHVPQSAAPANGESSSPRKRIRNTSANGDDEASNKDEARAVCALPEMSRFVLVAAYIASTNPPKSDLRMFGREAERRRKRKGGGARKNPVRSTQARVPQRLMGPTSFPLDRLLAILGFLLDSYNLDARNPGPEFSPPGSYTELELGRVHVYGAIAELAKMHLLQRTSPPDKIDGPPTFKCGISHDLALTLARDMHIPLLELLYETQN
ncbi:origin recognition complex subunit 5 C-terminus-domain-containing protein [Vararia minispora EC-137]|uniref:Origin recognition complex subunit 5 C-terminus-domain-containing protein n=1 Tax=Vararia minispora EC-137 TaxID=1314806 RepID=A0ACB8QV91_9AGAM|nr:origin recognition complex subunit 5 C-terminus-domain-containing protein [Vararia minispora EC-137]